MSSVEALDRLVLLAHCHGQWCPHPPALQQQSAVGKAGLNSCPGQRQRPGRRPELGTKARSWSESAPSSSGAELTGSPEPLDGELCLSYVCKSGHTFSWSPQTQGGWEGEGGVAGRPLKADPPRKQGQRQRSKAMREGARVEEEGFIMRTRSRSGAQQMETRCLTAQRAAGGQEEEEVRSAPATGTESTQGEELIQLFSGMCLCRLLSDYCSLMLTYRGQWTGGDRCRKHRRANRISSAIPAVVQ